MSYALAVIAALVLIVGVVRVAMWFADRSASGSRPSWSEASGDGWDGSHAHGDGGGGD